MGLAGQFEKEKLIVGIMYADRHWYSRCMEILTDEFGNVDGAMDEYAFSDYSHFYDNEMEGPVFKRFVSFERLEDPSRLPGIKTRTNEIECQLSSGGNRRVNIDPCFLGHGKFVMASTKNASFRIPIGQGIYAELSLVYARNAWKDFFWTYRDVRSEAVKAFLERMRGIYLAQRTGS